MYQAAEDRKISQLMTIDQSAALDVVSHEILVRKLRLYNVSEQAARWVRNYLSYRSNYVQVGGADTHFSATDRGVPQGSVIGPLFYTIFVNEITETTRDYDCTAEAHDDNTNLFGNPCTDCGVISSYANDSTFNVSSRNRGRNKVRMDKTLERIKIFLLENELHLNESKTTLLECMLPQKRVNTLGTPPYMDIVTEAGENKTITDSGQFRILGINLQGNLTWLAHLETGHKALLPSLRKQLGALQHLG